MSTGTLRRIPSAVRLILVSRMAKKRLTGKQQNFVNEYLIDLNATAAAKRAGYLVKAAKEMGYENLTKPHVAAEIAKRRQRMIEKLEITQEMVVQELAKIGFSDVGGFVRVADKLKALVSLARILGFMPTRVTVSAPDGGPVRLGLTLDELRARAARIMGSIEEEAIEVELVDEDEEAE